MNGENQPELIGFPCRFPIKVMGRAEAGFREQALKLVEQHAGRVDEQDVRATASRNRKFTALTITINASSQAQLDKIYQDLTDCEEVLVAL